MGKLLISCLVLPSKRAKIDGRKMSQYQQFVYVMFLFMFMIFYLFVLKHEVKYMVLRTVLLAKQLRYFIHADIL